MAQGDPVAIPRAAFERVSALCLALPEVTVRLDPSRVDWRSTAHSFDVRRRSFCLLIATADTSRTVVPPIVLRVHPHDRNALVSIGYPDFPSRAGRDRVAVLLTDDADWGEIRDSRNRELPAARAEETLRNARDQLDHLTPAHERKPVVTCSPEPTPLFANLKTTVPSIAG